MGNYPLDMFPLIPQKPYMAKKEYSMVFPTKYSESVQIGTFETFNKPSMTEPDNAMSIPEIIARFTRGYGIQVPVHPWEAGSAFDGDDPERFLEEEFGRKEASKEALQEAPKEAPKEAPQEPPKSEGE